MTVEILARRQWTDRDRLKATEDKGRHWKRLAGGYIADLSALRKCIVLCSLCVYKFNPRQHRYRKETDFPQVTGRCDGCKVHDVRCTAYIAEETYSQVRMTRDDMRSMARRGYKFSNG